MNKTSLAPHHRVMLLEESAISTDVVEGRGYHTVETKAELGRLGFARAQQNVPALLIPIHESNNSRVLHQLRPDQPRVDKRGKPVKYETPAEVRMALDVHPFTQKGLEDPSLPLYITEGIKKGDALVSQGLCSISLLAVWNWRGTNGLGGLSGSA